MTIQSLTRPMLVSFGLGILVVFVLSFSADSPQLLQVLAEFDWRLLPLILGLTLVNYLLRFVKWNYYLRVVGIRDVPIRQSALIFTAGLAMAITPGKVGELLKAYLLRYFRGIPIGTGAPIIIAERLTDGIAMLLLASGGLL
ncbi:MAG TPA: lysylphosphatidylglycerol synthase domain-containing protein, partial [Chloroflexota bacterium]|nr:lysylphosphatidylglycerol synthase domain-containing protein [Chloroflexota bacterium]